MLPQQQQQKQAAARMRQAAALQSTYKYNTMLPPLPAHHPLLAAAPPRQIEQTVTGNLPHGFDTSTCNSVSAELAILTLNMRPICGLPIIVNWAYARGEEDTTDHFHIFVGDLSPEVTDSALFAFFSGYASCSYARVMWDQNTGRSRGYGFVSFRDQQDAHSAINDLNGQWLGSWQIRCNWATKGTKGGKDNRQTSGSESVVDPTNNLTGHVCLVQKMRKRANEGAPENNPLYRTVYVGNLSHELAQNALHNIFHGLGAGVIEDVRVQYGKGFGFVRYSNHAETALAIHMANGRIVGGKPIKCSWGNKPTPPGAPSAPLPPPAASSLTDAGIIARGLAVATSRLASSQALLGLQHLKQAALGMGAGASQARYDGIFHNVGPSQPQLMYY